MCCSHGNPIITRKPRAAAKSSSQARRNCVDADCIQPGVSYRREVPLNYVWRGVICSVFIRAKGPIGHSADPELLFPNKKEFAPHMRSPEGRICMS